MTDEGGAMGLNRYEVECPESEQWTLRLRVRGSDRGELNAARVSSHDDAFSSEKAAL
jgi:hypothetical protein